MPALSRSRPRWARTSAAKPAPAKVPKDARDVAIGGMTNEAAARGASAAVVVE